MTNIGSLCLPGVRKSSNLVGKLAQRLLARYVGKVQFPQLLESYSLFDLEIKLDLDFPHHGRGVTSY
jgi:hypothetical protein